MHRHPLTTDLHCTALPGFTGSHPIPSRPLVTVRVRALHTYYYLPTLPLLCVHILISVSFRSLSMRSLLNSNFVSC
ncbi:hypothetical protein BV22DRAFT_1029695 [Leucogyrophana mollusca]|uniref:Uncharacterized protein n=1 Tax=Leucogyrophana mollusca TaxID=85980 RepID=A0ACB8BTI8_9AGAM|nr:hypothetical protein BV22DRAFT_1029695 [Leucogyrophana mollusca]